MFSKKPIKDLEPPLGDFFVSRLKEREVDSARFQSENSILSEIKPTLNSGMESADGQRLWYFCACGGGVAEATVNFVRKLVELCLLPNPRHQLSDFAVVFVADQDSETSKPVAGVIERYGSVMKDLIPEFASITANAFVRNGAFGAGTCIFSKSEEQTGTLEHVIYPIIKKAAPGRHQDAEAFIDKNPVKGEGVAADAKRLKAIMTIAGQPEKPGAPLSVILRDTQFLNDGDLKGDPLCQRYLTVLLGV